MGSSQVRGLRMHLRAVLGPAGDPRGRAPRSDHAASAALAGLHLVLGHLRRRGRGNVELLKLLHPCHRRVVQILPATSAALRCAHHRGAGNGHLAQR